MHPNDPTPLCYGRLFMGIFFSSPSFPYFPSLLCHSRSPSQWSTTMFETQQLTDVLDLCHICQMVIVHVTLIEMLCLLCPCSNLSHPTTTSPSSRIVGFMPKLSFPFLSNTSFCTKSSLLVLCTPNEQQLCSTCSPWISSNSSLWFLVTSFPLSSSTMGPLLILILSYLFIVFLAYQSQCASIVDMQIDPLLPLMESNPVQSIHRTYCLLTTVYVPTLFADDGKPLSLLRGSTLQLGLNFVICQSLMIDCWLLTRLTANPWLMIVNSIHFLIISCHYSYMRSMISN